MKIACQACQAKYTIADEKVLGKIVKIRCKKCGATIVINGNETGATHAASQAGGQAYDYAQQSGGEPWTVNVADGDQRTMVSAEIVGAFQSGVVNDETFCWKDGMSDWLPLRDIPELYAQCAGGQPAPPAPGQDDEATQAIATPGAGGFSSLFGSPGNGASGALFGGGEPPAAAPSAAAARRVGGRGGAGTDLFGGAAAAGGEEDVMTSASASPEAGPSKMTGERNENSVLFSLSALTQSAPKDDPKAAAPEGSGLIDIRALSQSMQRDDSSRGRGGAEDIMNLGGGGAFAPALAAPVLAPPPMDGHDYSPGGGDRRKSNIGLFIGLGVGFLAIVGGAIALTLYLAKPKDPIATTPTAAITTPTASALAMNDTTAMSTSSAAPPGTGATTGTPKGPATGGGGGGGARPVYTGGGGGGGGVIPTSTGGGGGCCPGETEMQCNMRKSAGQPCAAAPPPVNTGAGAAPFDRGAAAGALGAVNLSSCKKADGPTGSGHVKVTFAPSGVVSAVEVDQPPFSGTAVGGCIAQKYRGAKIPAFNSTPVTVGKSFSLN